MAVNERARHELYQRLEQTLGEEATATLMEYLPPVGWADVATKTDLVALENKLLAEIHRAVRSMTFGVLAANATVAGLAIALAQVL